jgi:hypothetical protein
MNEELRTYSKCNEPIYIWNIIGMEYASKAIHFPHPKHKPIKLTCEIHENLNDKGSNA